MGLERWLVLGFLLTLAVPVLLERLRRRRAQPIELPAIRHLLREHARFQRVLALRRWLVLVLRMAAIGFLVLTFARPYLERDVRVGRGLAADTAAVLVLDTSALARVRVDQESLLDAERALAEGFLKERAPDALVAVTGLPPAGRALHLVFEQDAAVLSDELAALDVAGAPEDPALVLEQARAALAGHPRARRDVIWISARRVVVPETRDSAPGVRVLQVHPAPDEPPRGVVLRELSVEPGAVVSEVVNLAERPFRGKLVVHGRGQRPLHSAELSLEAWESQRVTLPIPQGEAFLGSVRVLPATALERYQVRFFAAGVARGQVSRIFLVRTGAEGEAHEDPNFYLRSALLAAGEGAPRLASLADLADDAPRAGDWVFVAAEGADLPGLVPTARGWLEAGARVALLLQSEPPPMFDLFGVTLVGPSSRVHTGFTSSLPLATELAACLADATTRALVQTSETRAAGFATLASTADGQPLLLGRRVGAGYLALELSGLAPTRTDLPFHACYPAWIEAVLHHVANATLSPARTVYVEGEDFDAPPDLPGGSATLTDPEGRARSLDDGPLRLDAVGLHRVRLDDRGRIVTWEAAVNPRVDLDRATLEWPAEEPASEGLTVPRRVDLSDFVLLIALLVLVPEVIVALRLTRRRPTGS